MKILHKHNIYLDKRQSNVYIDVMQADAYTRVLELSLYSGGVAWDVPKGVHVAVAYGGASGKGIYDTLPDGSAACTVAGNVVTAVVAPQALAMYGETKLTVVFDDGNGHQLASFCVTLKVEYNPAVGAVKPPDYINLRQWMSAELLAMLEDLGVNHDFVFEVVGNVNTDATMADILAAEQAGRTVYCSLETDGQQVITLPKVKDDHGVYYFSAVCEGVEYLVTIKEDDVGNTVTNVTQREVSGGNVDQSGGFSQPLRVAIYNLLMDAVYQSAGHEADKAALEELLNGNSGGGTVEPDEPVITYYTIEKTLTNVSISNGAASVAAGSSFTATLTADEGYTLGDVVVTMGGEAIAVTDGIIEIAAVTGNIVITATATAEETGGYVWTSGTPYDFTDKTITGTKLNFTTGAEEASEGASCTDYINCFDVDYLYYSVGIQRILFYDVNKNFISSYYKNTVPATAKVPDNAVFFRVNDPTMTVTPITVGAESYTPGVQDVTWVKGDLDYQTGAEKSSSRYRTEDYICIRDARCLEVSNATQVIRICYYDAYKNFICGQQGLVEPINLTAVNYAAFTYVRLNMAAPSDITVDDADVYSVTRKMTKVTLSHVAPAKEGATYTNSLVIADGYTLDESTVSVTMGGVDITDTAYADGAITIENVSGEIVISAVAVAAETTAE